MLSYYKYYLEIRNRLALLILTWVFSLIVGYTYKETLLFVLIDSNGYVRNFSNSEAYFIFTNITEVFQVYVELIVFLSNQITLNLVGYHLIMFISSGLYSFEFVRLRFSYKIFLISWVFSIVLLCHFVIPFSWDFFLSFQKNSNDIQPTSFFFEAKIGDYFNYFSSLYYICYFNCQFLAILTYFLIHMSEKLDKTREFRKLFYLVFVLFSTIMTPPDVISQILMSLFLIASYELIVFIRCLKKN